MSGLDSDNIIICADISETRTLIIILTPCDLVLGPWGKPPHAMPTVIDLQVLVFFRCAEKLEHWSGMLADF